MISNSFLLCVIKSRKWRFHVNLFWSTTLLKSSVTVLVVVSLAHYWNRRVSLELKMCGCHFLALNPRSSKHGIYDLLREHLLIFILVVITVFNALLRLILCHVFESDPRFLLILNSLTVLFIVPNHDRPNFLFIFFLICLLYFRSIF